MVVVSVKDERLQQTRERVTELVAIAASEVGGLTEAEADHWWDEIQAGVMDAFEGVTVDTHEPEEGR